VARDRDCRITGYTEIWERAEAEKQPQILPPRCASRQDDSAGGWRSSVAVAVCRSQTSGFPTMRHCQKKLPIVNAFFDD
jgi:hypothetical protein